MDKLSRFFSLKGRKHSLFLRLLFSFLFIISLLVCFILVSFSVFKNNIQDQILKYNNLNLNNTTNNFEDDFRAINDLLLNFYFNEKVQSLNSPEMDYAKASQVIRDIQSMVSSEQYYLDNILIYYKNSDFVITKDRGTSASNMFTRFYYSPQYQSSFWSKQFNENNSFRIYPATVFSEQNYDQYTSLGIQIPIVIKNYLNPNFYIVAFLDAPRAMNAYHQSINNNFAILDQNGHPLFASTPIDVTLPSLTKDGGYIQMGKSYYFYKKGPFTGLTYVNIISDQHIYSQIQKLVLTLIILLLVSILLSVAVSILFSFKLNNPVKKLVESIEHFKPEKTFRTGIKEFDAISRNIKQIMETNHSIKKDLTQKNGLLQQFAFTNNLKKIYNNFYEFTNFSKTDKPYVFVLFKVAFKKDFQVEIKEKTERATYFIREFIQLKISEFYTESYTVQVENDLILSTVFLKESSYDELFRVLEEIKQLLDMDRQYCYLTIAASSMYSDTDFTPAYEEALRRLEQRHFVDQSQIIVEGPEESIKVFLTDTQEHELNVNLSAGNETAVIDLVNRILIQMKNRKATAPQFIQFAEEIVQKVIRKLTSLNVDTNQTDLHSFYSAVGSCHTVSELQSFFDGFLSKTTRMIKEKREHHGSPISFVFDYLEQHYTEDITLEIVADKLNISGGHLSTYFKEKTGKNFIDYVNELRISKAKEKLLHTNEKIKDVAFQVGYNNLNSFHRMFKKFTGLTPNEFRMTQNS